MDGSMPEMNGIETTRRLKRLQPKAKIIGLTLYGESTYLEENGSRWRQRLRDEDWDARKRD